MRNWRNAKLDVFCFCLMLYLLVNEQKYLKIILLDLKFSIPKSTARVYTILNQEDPAFGLSISMALPFGQK